MEAHMLFFLHSFLLLLYMLPVSTALDSISSVQSIRGEETLISAGGTFELGFFSPGTSKSWYLGIWYKEVSVRTVVWVANRENPLANSSGTLKLSVQGNLSLVSQNESIIWYSNSSRLARMPVAQLLNSGNLVVRDGNDNDPDAFLWQSFDHPYDTLLPGMKLGRNKTTGFDRILTSWKSPEDPSPGSFTFRVETSGYPQLVLSQGSVIRYRTGPWNGIRSSGMRDVKENGFLLSENEMYYELLNSSVLLRMVLSSNGVVQRYMLSDPAQGWSLYLAALIDNCDAYALCGAYGSCNVDNSPLCQCMSGFVPKSVEERGAVDWSTGCNRRTPLDCKGDVFFKYSDVKLPDAQRSWFNMSLNLDECRMICEKNCTCTAYANLDIEREGRGCLLWFGDLIDVQEHAVHGQDLYIRMASSESVRIYGDGSKHNKKKQVPMIVSSVFAGMLVIGLGLTVYILRKKQRLNRQEGDPSTEIQKEDLELPLFDFTTIETATNNFSTENKLGEGGFGPVYKGILKEGQEIAVKRLSRNSRQGLTEFMNEVMCIAKLQHRNLVKLLGCCIQEEKMLLYELMPNKSLDFFIFDQRKREMLNWQKRFHIITGIGRGLLYLHQDSRLRIVHRDLKASNVLLDHEMNPKISDFGLARSFGGNETKANTNRVVGTYGYMSPEYAIHGIFSIKSDVFSYGVLVLEIVTGKKNRGFYHPDHCHNLLGHAWKLFKEGRSLELIDELIGNSCNISEVLRSIHVGLLCVQRSPEDRPNMPSVILMLSSEKSLPQPKEPGFFFTERELFEADSLANKHELCSEKNEITQTMLSAR